MDQSIDKKVSSRMPHVTAIADNQKCYNCNTIDGLYKPNTYYLWKVTINHQDIIYMCNSCYNNFITFTYNRETNQFRINPT